MKVIYVLTPVITGYFIMEWAVGKSHENLKDFKVSQPNIANREQNAELQKLLDRIKSGRESSK